MLSVSSKSQSSCAVQLRSQAASMSASRCCWLSGAARPTVHHQAAACQRQNHRVLGQSTPRPCLPGLTHAARFLAACQSCDASVTQGSPPHLRLPHTHADQERPPHSEAAPRQGPQEPVPSQHTVLSWQEAVTAPITCQQHQRCGRLHCMTRHSRWRCLVCVCVYAVDAGGGRAWGWGGTGWSFWVA